MSQYLLHFIFCSSDSFVKLDHIVEVNLTILLIIMVRFTNEYAEKRKPKRNRWKVLREPEFLLFLCVLFRMELQPDTLLKEVSCNDDPLETT